MRRGVGDNRPQDGCVEDQYRPGDSGHPAGHHHEQLAAREACEIRPDEQRGLDHAEENIGCSREPDRAAHIEGALEQPGKAPHDRRQDAPVEQERCQDAHDQHHGQRLQSQHEIRPGRF
jgi:hypothetical protein